MNKLTRMITNEYGTVTRIAEETGIPISTIYSMIDRGGINTATVSNALKIAKALGTTIEELTEPEKEYPKLTRFQFELLNYMASDYEWMGRNKNGSLHFYEAKPIKRESYWDTAIDNYVSIPTQLDAFKFIKWEDSEPWNIKELLENCEVED